MGSDKHWRGAGGRSTRDELEAEAAARYGLADGVPCGGYGRPRQVGSLPSVLRRMTVGQSIVIPVTSRALVLVCARAEGRRFTTSRYDTDGQTKLVTSKGKPAIRVWRLE